MAPVGCSVQELSAQLLSLLFFLPWQWQKWHQVDVSRPLNLMWWQWMRYYPQDWRLCGWVNIWIHPTTHFLFIYHFYLYHFAALHPLSLSLSHIDTHTSEERSMKSVRVRPWREQRAHTFYPIKLDWFIVSAAQSLKLWVSFWFLKRVMVQPAISKAFNQTSKTCNVLRPVC